MVRKLSDVERVIKWRIAIFAQRQRGRGPYLAVGLTEVTKSSHARWVQYRARKQAAVPSAGRLLTRAVLYRRPNVASPDLAPDGRNRCVIHLLDHGTHYVAPLTITAPGRLRIPGTRGRREPSFKATCF